MSQHVGLLFQRACGSPDDIRFLVLRNFLSTTCVVGIKLATRLLSGDLNLEPLHAQSLSLNPYPLLLFLPILCVVMFAFFQSGT